MGAAGSREAVWGGRCSKLKPPMKSVCSELQQASDSQLRCSRCFGERHCRAVLECPKALTDTDRQDLCLLDM